MAQVESLEIRVLEKGIHCDGCENHIQTTISRLPGVVKVKADHKTQRVHLTLNQEKTSLEEVREKLEFMGYKTA